MSRVFFKYTDVGRWAEVIAECVLWSLVSVCCWQRLRGCPRCTWLALFSWSRFASEAFVLECASARWLVSRLTSHLRLRIVLDATPVRATPHALMAMAASTWPALTSVCALVCRALELLATLAELLPVAAASASAKASDSSASGGADTVLAGATVTLPRLALAAAHVDPHTLNSSGAGASVSHGLAYTMNYSTSPAQVRFSCLLGSYWVSDLISLHTAISRVLVLFTRTPSRNSSYELKAFSPFWMQAKLGMGNVSSLDDVLGVFIPAASLVAAATNTSNRTVRATFTYLTSDTLFKVRY